MSGPEGSPAGARATPPAAGAAADGRLPLPLLRAAALCLTTGAVLALSGCASIPTKSWRAWTPASTPGKSMPITRTPAWLRGSILSSPFSRGVAPRIAENADARITPAHTLAITVPVSPRCGSASENGSQRNAITSRKYQAGGRSAPISAETGPVGRCGRG